MANEITMPAWGVTIPNSSRKVGSTLLSDLWEKFPVSHFLKEVLWWWRILRQLCHRMKWEQRFNLTSHQKLSFSVWIPAPAGGRTNSHSITVVLPWRCVTCQSSEISYEMCVRVMLFRQKAGQQYTSLKTPFSYRCITIRDGKGGHQVHFLCQGRRSLRFCFI